MKTKTIYYSSKRKAWLFEVGVRHPDGRELSKKGHADTKGAANTTADAEQAKLWTQLYEPHLIPPNAPKLKEFRDPCLAWYTKQAKKQSTAIARTHHLDRYVMPVLGNCRLHEIELPQVEAVTEYARSLGIKNPATLNNALGILGIVLKRAKALGLIQKLPTIQFFKVTPPEADSLTDEEDSRLLAAADSPLWRAAFHLAGQSSALRRNEILGAEWQYIDWEQRIYKVCWQLWRGEKILPKGGITGDVPLTEATIQALKALGPKESGFIFPDLTESTMGYQLNRLSRLIGLRPIGWHVLRHGALTRLARQGTPIHILQKIARHRSIVTTQRYLHAFREDMQAAAAKLDKGAATPKTTLTKERAAENLSVNWLGELLYKRSGSETTSLKSLDDSDTYPAKPHPDPTSTSSLVSSRALLCPLASSCQPPKQPSPQDELGYGGCFTGEILAYGFLEQAELSGLWLDGALVDGGASC